MSPWVQPDPVVPKDEWVLHPSPGEPGKKGGVQAKKLVTLGESPWPPLPPPGRCHGSEAHVPTLMEAHSLSWKWSGHCPHGGLWDRAPGQGCRLGLADPNKLTVTRPFPHSRESRAGWPPAECPKPACLASPGSREPTAVLQHRAVSCHPHAHTHTCQ